MASKITVSLIMLTLVLCTSALLTSVKSKEGVSVPSITEKNREADKAFIQWKMYAPGSPLSLSHHCPLLRLACQLVIGLCSGETQGSSWLIAAVTVVMGIYMCVGWGVPG